MLVDSRVALASGRDVPRNSRTFLDACTGAGTTDLAPTLLFLAILNFYSIFTEKVVS